MNTNQNQNKDLLIRELQEQADAFREMVENQFTIIGIKDLLIFRLNQQLSQLITEKETLEAKIEDVYWTFPRSN